VSVVFYFSSRRRHTRFSRDWSSVCSSDLNNLKARKWLATKTSMAGNLAALVEIIGRGVFGGHPILLIGPGTQIDQFAALRAEGRSEERRVGKERRGRRGVRVRGQQGRTRR